MFFFEKKSAAWQWFIGILAKISATPISMTSVPHADPYMDHWSTPNLSFMLTSCSLDNLMQFRCGLLGREKGSAHCFRFFTTLHREDIPWSVMNCKIPNKRLTLIKRPVFRLISMDSWCDNSFDLLLLPLLTRYVERNRLSILRSNGRFQ
jgi:hypothetical protein